MLGRNDIDFIEMEHESGRFYHSFDNAGNFPQESENGHGFQVRDARHGAIRSGSY
jgi:hypothetical protein